MTVAPPGTEWIKKIDAALASLSESPEFLGPQFPLEEVQKALRDLFGKPSLVLSTQVKGWTHSSAAFEGLPTPRASLSLVFTPLSSPLYFVMSEQDLKFIMSALLGGDDASAPFLSSSEMKGFYTYLGLEVLSVLDKIQFVSGLSPRLEEAPKSLESVLANTECFVVDVSCKLAQGTFAGRILIPARFKKEWKEHFAKLPPPPLTKEQKEKIPVEVAFEAGNGRLTLAEWKGVKPGDFVVLEKSTIEIPGKKGRVILTLGGEPIFRGKLTGDGIKLLEYPLYEEVNASMDEKFSEEEIDLYGDVESAGIEEKVATTVEQVTPTISPDKIPILLTVEVARVKMTAEELSKLSPGTLLDLKVRPEEGVDLVISGKKVGRGELVKIGETLGVRVTQL